MPTGIVKWFSEEKGYGYITQEDGEDVFIHYLEIEDADSRTLQQGERVEFETTRGKKGLQAVNLKKLPM